MSNYFILITDRQISNSLVSKQVIVPKSIKSCVKFNANFAYKIEIESNDRKELIAKEYAPMVYKKTSDWFDRLSNLITNVLTDGTNIVMIETYYEQNLENIIWDSKQFPIKNFKNDEVAFEFDTIYSFTI